MPNWFVVLAGVILLIAAYVLVYPQSVYYAALVAVIGLYALATGFDLPKMFSRSSKKP